jgi:predicted permease
MTRSELLDAVRQDVIYGSRQLRKSPAFTLVATLTLAIGIGATSAIFSVVNSVLLRPLPYANPDRVLRLSQRNGRDKMPTIPFGNYLTWRREAIGFEEIGATWGPQRPTLIGVGEPSPLPTVMASSGYFKVLSIKPVLGRYFTDAEDRPGGPPVIVISRGLWQHRFNGDRNVLGRLVTLGAKTYSVIGVAPDDYLLEPTVEAAWIPLAPPPNRFTDFVDHELTVYGLIKPGIARVAAARQLQVIETRLARENPHSGYDGRLIAEPITDDLLGSYRPRLYLFLGAVVLVLLIACGNTANLLLARASVRRTEIAVRGALGASRRRIVSQLLVESILLAIIGALFGAAVAVAGIKFLVSSPIPVPRLHETRLDATAIAFTMALALLSAIVFGLAPALGAARQDLQQTLRAAGRESRGTGYQRLRHLLIIGELCLTQVLLIGAGLLIRSAIAMSAVPVGFDTHNLLAFTIAMGPSEPTYSNIERAIAALPGVQSVGRAQIAPLYGSGWYWTAKREGSDGHDEGSVGANMRSISPNYFATLRLPLLRGRSFTSSDAVNSSRVAIVSRGLAERLWPGQDAIGKRISNGGDIWREVVGIAADMRANGVKDIWVREMYVPAAQQVNTGSAGFAVPFAYTYVVRGNVPVMTLVPTIRRTIAGINARVAVVNPATMDDALNKLLATDRFTRWLLSLLGVTALALAVVGVYGVIACFVTQRHHELGVRIALGAPRGAVRWLVVRQGLAVALLASGIGLPMALAAMTLLQSSTFGVATHDPATFGAVGAMLVLVAILAAYIPARRATRIDPMEALRNS